MESNLVVNVLYLILKALEKILERLEGKSVDTDKIDLHDLIDGVEVKSILKFAKSSLYRLKLSKAVRTVRIGKRDYYFRSEIESHIKRFMK